MTDSISTTVTTTVTLGSAGYADSLTITSSGAVEPTQYGAVGVDSAVPGATLTNEGTVIGGVGQPGNQASDYVAYTGGVGVDLSGAATLINTGSIAGGVGGSGTSGGYGGVGVELLSAGATLNNSGTIAGGAGGPDLGKMNGGTAVEFAGATLTNSGSIVGGVGGGEFELNGSFGGIGLSLSGGAIATNSVGGTIAGGNQGSGTGDYGGGVGATVAGATLDNDGQITGGGGSEIQGGPQPPGGTGGTGVVLSENGTLDNTGQINGGYGAYAESMGSNGGAGLQLNADGGSATNSGTITGGAGGGGYQGTGADGAAGAYVSGTGASLTNLTTGHIQGGDGGDTADQVPAAGGGGGTGVVVGGGLLTNAGSIVGGYAGETGYGGGGSIGAIGVSLTGGQLTATASSSIAGGAGADGSYASGNPGGSYGAGGAGGAGVVASLTGRVSNAGHISGGAGGATDGTTAISHAGNGGSGAALLGGGYLDNSGFIVGGNGGVSSAPATAGNGGAGVYLNGGTLVTSGTISGGAGGTTGAGGAAGAAGDALLFGAAPSTVQVAAGAVFDGSIGGFAVGDVIDLTNLTPGEAQADFNPTTDVLTTPADGTLAFAGATGETFVFSPDGTGGTDIAVACYLVGTRIRAANGEVPIESLRIGDRIAVRGGQNRAIRWIGRRTYTKEFASGNREVLPVLIEAGAFGLGSPWRDLWVSPEHAMYMAGLLVPARALINGTTIRQPDANGHIAYLHLEFERHELILAEGVWSESFIDDGSRDLFDNAAEYAQRYPRAVPMPVLYCAPRVADGWELEQVRRTLAIDAKRRSGGNRPTHGGSAEAWSAR